MARYLSPEWFDELNAAAGQQSSSVPGPGHLTIQQVVTDGPDGDVRYWVRLHDGAVSAGLGEAESPDAVISQSYDTAVGVVRGHVRVQSALIAGDIRLAGDIATLIDHQEALSDVYALFADVRERTSYS